LLATWSRGTIGFWAAVTVMAPSSSARAASTGLTVIVCPASTRTFRTSVGAYPMYWARTVTTLAGTLFMK